MLTKPKARSLLFKFREGNFYITDFSIEISESNFGHKEYMLNGIVHGAKTLLTDFNSLTGKEFIGYTDDISFCGDVAYITLEGIILHNEDFGEPSRNIRIHFNSIDLYNYKVITRYNRNGKKIKVRDNR